MNLLRPKLLREKIIRAGWGKRVLERTFEFADGKRDFLVWGGDVTPAIVFPLTHAREVVALREFRYAANDFVINLPGGCPEKNEGFHALARRELEEETGFAPEEVATLGPPLWFEPTACITPYMPVLAVNCVKVAEPHPDETEISEPVLFPLEQWIRMIRDREIVDSKSIAVTFLALFEIGLDISPS